MLTENVLRVTTQHAKGCSHDRRERARLHWSQGYLSIHISRGPLVFELQRFREFCLCSKTGLNSYFGVLLFASPFALVCMGCGSYRYNFGMGLNYQQLLKNVPMGAGGNEVLRSEARFLFCPKVPGGMGAMGLFPSI